MLAELDILLATRCLFLAEDAFHTGSPGPCPQFLVGSGLIAQFQLLFCTFYFDCFMFFVVYLCSCLVFIIFF